MGQSWAEDEVERLQKIVTAIKRLSPAGKEYLRSRLSDLSLFTED